MKIYVARHGQTDYNAEKKAIGAETDCSLNARGLEQARQLSAELEDADFAMVFVSPLLRTRQTVDAIVGKRDVPVIVDERLIAGHLGIFEGVSYDNEEFRESWKDLTAPLPGGGESQVQIQERVAAFLQELPVKCGGEDVLIVTHGRICKTIAGYFSAPPQPLVPDRVPNCKVMCFELS